jgi:beta-mannosidase
MITINLNGAWRMRRSGDSEWLDAVVPGSVYADLMRAERMEDPFYRDNEDAALKLCNDDYEYMRMFRIENGLLSANHVLLRCEGLDTLCEIFINGRSLARTDNMHRTYELNIQPYLNEGDNELRLLFSSPTRYAAEKHAENPVWGVSEAVQGFNHIRKAHSMFGWDWGPKLPDMGIWRSISLVAYQSVRLDDVHIQQMHQDGCVAVSLDVTAKVWTDAEVNVKLVVRDPEGRQLAGPQIRSLSSDQAAVRFELDIPNPELWWPNGYGKQPLYTVDLQLLHNGVEADSRNFSIGLRTLRLKREQDQWGEGFAIEINGVAIFAQGANYIPEDNVLSRVTKERTERLLQDCVEAHFNCIRIWGGGYYPDNDFYNLCDRYGLIVWQDFMFACAVYDFNEAFADNIRQEAIDNVKRLRHHASLALWCGNNEIETAMVDWGILKDKPHLRASYLKQYEILLANVVKQYDPERDYWPSSPSSGGSFDNPNDPNRGDVHYWEVWHALKPFTEYRKYHFRFCSEFGFQSFPGPKTVNSFTLPEDRNVFSYVMEKHQKNAAANGKILYYLSDNFKYPKDFDSMLYSSQMLQAEAIKYGVEHWRRNRGRCMGSIYWQLNDCWPVASWSSVDSFGRWKALHYFAKRFYAPVLISAQEENTKVDLYITNDTQSPVQGSIEWWLKDRTGRILKKGKEAAAVPALQASCCVSLDFGSDLQENGAARRTYLEYAFTADGQELGRDTVLFTKAKYFEFEASSIQVEVSEREFAFDITLSARSYAKYVTLELAEADAVFSDNSFHLSGGEPRTVQLEKKRLSAPLNLHQLREQLQVTHLKEWS